jgi:hypothetical protein
LTLGLGTAHAESLSSKEFGSLKKKASRALKTGDMSSVASAVGQIAGDDSKRAFDYLLTFAKVPDGNVYNAARDGIAGMRAAEVDDAIQSVLSKGGSTLSKLLVIDAMTERGDKFAGEAIGTAVGKARKPEVQRAGITAIKSKKLLGGVSGLIEALAKLEKKGDDDLNLNLVRDTLQSLTGESFKTAADWKNFWEPRKNGFSRPTTGGVREQGGTARRKRPTFFGSEIKSSRLVFVIDTSGSMEAADGGPMGTGGRGAGGMPPTGGPAGAGAAPGANSRVRIERAKHQLAQAIEALPAKTRFTIVAYSGVLMVGPNGPVTPPGMKPNGVLPPKIGNIEWLKTWKPKLMPASDKNKKDALAFVKELKANGGTFTLNALKAAFEVAGADTIVLLSDGMPNEHDFKNNKPYTPDEILNEVATMNRVKRRIIDTFGFDEASGGGGNRGRGLAGGHRRGSGAGAPPAGFPGGAGGAGGGLGKFMQDLADQNGGDYTQIQ